MLRELDHGFMNAVALNSVGCPNNQNRELARASRTVEISI
jgi:hypothetical protein